MHVPVKDEQNQIRLLRVMDETVYIQAGRNGGLIFYTEGGTYTLIRNVEDWASLLETLAVNFFQVDRGTIVNLQKSWEFSSELRVLKLQDDRNKILIPVAERKAAKLKNAITKS